MTPHCPERPLLQDHLDGLTSGTRRVEMEAHLAVCDACARELAALRRLVMVLERLPLDVPSAALANRILAGVLPRHRRRWAAAVGWSYAASLALCGAGAAILAASPTARAVLNEVFAAFSRGFVQVAVIGLDGMTRFALGCAESLRWIAAAGDTIVPLSRALTSLFGSPMLQTALAGAFAACVVVMWWMHTRERPASRRMDHVAWVGF